MEIRCQLSVPRTILSFLTEPPHDPLIMTFPKLGVTTVHTWHGLKLDLWGDVEKTGEARFEIATNTYAYTEV